MRGASPASAFCGDLGAARYVLIIISHSPLKSKLFFLEKRGGVSLREEKCVFIE